jgi:hypothetical protein
MTARKRGLHFTPPELPELRLTREQLLAKYGPNYGLGPVEPPKDPEKIAERDRQDREANRAAILREYAAAGIEPVQWGDFGIVALSLARQMESQGRLALKKKTETAA